MGDVNLWGTGKTAERLVTCIKENIILVIDNDRKKWGTVRNGYTVCAPDNISEFHGRFDKIIIASVSWRCIRRQIMKEFDVEQVQIENMYYQ